MSEGSITRRHYPYRLDLVVRVWVEKTFPTLLSQHVKATVTFDAGYSGERPNGICTCGEMIEGNIAQLQTGTAMNKHIAMVIADTIAADEREKERRRDAFRRDWMAKKRQRRDRFSPGGKVRGK
jgi:hypothetical protein